jgi:hypothetical protein
MKGTETAPGFGPKFPFHRITDVALVNMERTTVKSLIRSHRSQWGWFLCFLCLAFQGWVADCWAADSYRLQLLDGKVLEGTIVAISLQKVQFATSAGTQEFPAEQIRSLKHLFSAENNAKLPPLTLELRDGTTLRATSAEITGKAAIVKLGNVEQKFPAAEIRWIRFRETVAANDSTWQEILATDTKSDRLIIVRTGDTLDTIAGLVSGMDANEVRFNFDGEEIKAPRNKLLGMTLFSTNKKSYAPAKIKVTTVTQDSFAAVAVENIRENDVDLLKVVTAADIAFQIPWDLVDQLDFSAGNLQMLADLPPIQSAALLDADFPGDVELAKKLFAPHADHYGRESTENNLPKTDFVFQGSGTAEYRVPEGMSRFQTSIAGSPNAQLRGWTIITVQQEETILFQQSFRPESDRLTIDVPVISKRRLTLKVQPENPRQASDTIWWLQPRFVK